MVHLLPTRPKQSKVRDYEVFSTKFSSLIPDYTTRNQPIAEYIEHHYLGRKRKHGKIYSIAKGTLRQAGEIEDYLSQCKDKRVRFRPSGVFMILIESEFGQGWLDELRESLYRIIRTSQILRALKKHSLEPSIVTLQNVTFSYSPEQSCILTFPKDHTQAISIDLLPADTNPHIRVKSILEFHLAASPNAFLHSLKTSLPVVRALYRAETQGVASIRPRSIDQYRIAYANLWTVFNVQVVMHRGVQEWQLSEMPPPGANNPVMVKQVLQNRLPEQKLFMDEYWKTGGGEGIRAMGNMMVCSQEGVERAVDGLDAVMRRVYKVKLDKTMSMKAEDDKGQGQGQADADGKARGGGVPANADVITLE